MILLRSAKRADLFYLKRQKGNVFSFRALFHLEKV